MSWLLLKSGPRSGTFVAVVSIWLAFVHDSVFSALLSSPSERLGVGARPARRPRSVSDAFSLRRGVAFYLGSKLALSQLTRYERCLLRRAPSDDVYVDFGPLHDDIQMLLRLVNVKFTFVKSVSQIPHSSQSYGCKSFFVNSGSVLLSLEKKQRKNRIVSRLRRFVRRGGSLLTTDRAVELANRIVPQKNGWELRYQRPLNEGQNINLAITSGQRRDDRNLSMSLPVSRPSCGERNVTEMVDFLMRFFTLYNVDSTPLWHLRPFSPLLHLTNRERTSRKAGYQVLLRSDDLPEERDTLLTCADVTNGTYFHMVGPLAQDFDETSVTNDTSTSAEHARMQPFTEAMLRFLTSRNLIRIGARHHDEIIKSMRLLEQQQTAPLLLEHVATAAVSCSLVARFLLQSRLRPGCSNEALLRKCASRQNTAAGPTTTLNKLNPTSSVAGESTSNAHDVESMLTVLPVESNPTSTSLAHTTHASTEALSLTNRPLTIA